MALSASSGAAESSSPASGESGTSSEVIEVILQSEEPQTEVSSEPETETGSNSLIVYFSWSGNTESVANEIQAQTGGDIFEIVPAESYTDDYDALLDIAQEEQANGARPAIAETVENFEQYDTVYFGFPNWWGDMPMILYTFLDEYDFSGKTIALFGSYGWGDGEWMRTWEAECQAAGAELACDSVICQDEPDGDALTQCEALGHALK